MYISYTVKPLYKGHWIKDSFLIRTLSAAPIMESCVQIYFWIRDTSLHRTASYAPMVSVMERCHCTMLDHSSIEYQWLDQREQWSHPPNEGQTLVLLEQIDTWWLLTGTIPVVLHAGGVPLTAAAWEGPLAVATVVLAASSASSALVDILWTVGAWQGGEESRHSHMNSINCIQNSALRLLHTHICTFTHTYTHTHTDTRTHAHTHTTSLHLCMFPHHHSKRTHQCRNNCNPQQCWCKSENIHVHLKYIHPHLQTWRQSCT